MSSRNDFDTTIFALQIGIPSLSTSTAVATIDDWANRLQCVELASLTETLPQLRGELTSGQLVGTHIGALLTELGNQTGIIASRAEPGMVGRLQQLASLLMYAGSTITLTSHFSSLMPVGKYPQGFAYETMQPVRARHHEML